MYWMSFFGVRDSVHPQHNPKQKQPCLPPEDVRRQRRGEVPAVLGDEQRREREEQACAPAQGVLECVSKVF